ncbi:HAAS signaling domain-containing protein [Gimesia sp.]|uniref:HAAS signaling domain-containing protein n=1 Tax=Gimesia sp. TaxID=2024833 RepID=UPI003A924343
MNAASASLPKWKQILQTPISHLLRGQITGPPEPLEQLDTSALPENLIEAIRQITDHLDSRLRWKVAIRLTKSCSSLLREGCAATQLVEQLSEPTSIAALIRITRRTDWILNAPLPARLWPTVERIVIHEGVKRRAARRMLKQVCQTLQWQLDGGCSPEAINSQCGEAAALSGLVYETDSLGELLEYRLSEPVLAVVLNVVQRTRLWPAEKQDVARELCAHFADGLERGESEAALIESFGSPQTAAKLIRRARLRNRPFHWRARRRVWQTLIVASILILIPWSVVTVRLMVARPTIRFDVIQQMDDESRKISREERAWPLYLQGLSMLTKVDRIKSAKLNLAEMSDGPASKDWPDVKKYLKSHSQQIDTYLQAASRPALGFINRPLPNDLNQFRELNRPYEMNPAGNTDFNIYLPQAEALSGSVISLLTGAIHLAAEEGNAERCLELLLARINVVEHYRQTGPWAIIQSSANGEAGRSARLAAEIVETYPNLFNDQQLKVLFQKVQQMPMPPLNISETREQDVQNLLQHAYTDDGNDDGRFTIRGFQSLQTLAESSIHDRNLLLSTIPSLVRQDPKEPDRNSWIPFQVQSGFLAMQIADRKEMRRELLYLNQLLIEAITQATPEAEDAYNKEYHRLMDSPELRLKYLPALLLMSPFESYTYMNFHKNSVTHRAAALTILAAEMYRRDHGRFPKSLQELVPTYFAEIPVDPQTGKPLRYQLKDGHPTIEADALDSQAEKSE